MCNQYPAPISIDEDIYELPRFRGRMRNNFQTTKLNYRLKPTVELSIIARLLSYCTIIIRLTQVGSVHFERYQGQLVFWVSTGSYLFLQENVTFHFM